MSLEGMPMGKRLQHIVSLLGGTRSTGLVTGTFCAALLSVAMFAAMVPAVLGDMGMLGMSIQDGQPVDSEGNANGRAEAAASGQGGEAAAGSQSRGTASLELPGISGAAGGDGIADGQRASDAAAGSDDQGSSGANQTGTSTGSGGSSANNSAVADDGAAQDAAAKAEEERNARYSAEYTRIQEIMPIIQDDGTYLTNVFFRTNASSIRDGIGNGRQSDQAIAAERRIFDEVRADATLYRSAAYRPSGEFEEFVRAYDELDKAWEGYLEGIALLETFYDRITTCPDLVNHTDCFMKDLRPHFMTVVPQGSPEGYVVLDVIENARRRAGTAYDALWDACNQNAFLPS